LCQSFIAIKGVLLPKADCRIQFMAQVLRRQD
jgi:hypothetical protein